MVTVRYYHLLPLLLLLPVYNSYAMHTLARTRALHKIPTRIYAHAVRKLYTAHQAHNTAKLSSTDTHSNNDEQSYSQNQQSKEQRYQKFKDRLSTASAFIIGAGTGYVVHELDEERRKKGLLLHIMTTTSNKKLIQYILTAHNFGIVELQKLLTEAVLSENYTLVTVLLETLSPVKINQALECYYDEVRKKLIEETAKDHKSIPMSQILHSSPAIPKRKELNTEDKYSGELCPPCNVQCT